MINRSRYKRLMAMSPGAQFWEKRYIAYQQGAYHQPGWYDELLRDIEYAIKLHREQDEREAKKKKPNGQN